MRSGFSLIELVIALVIFQVGLLATAGMVVLAQRNLLRAEITVRGVLAAGWVADSLERVNDPGQGRRAHPWGEVSWLPADDEIGGVLVAVFSPLLGDTLVRLRAVEAHRGEPDRSIGPVPPGGRP
jgi:prepilin-type N-terminal cleavage/methylation domain-containing protein